MKLSVIVSGIRKDRWNNFYKSIQNAYSGEFELIICGPYDIPEELKYKNIIWIEDFGSPTRCMQRALIASKGEYILPSWDDALFYPGMIDETFKLLDDNYKTVISSKYLESDLEISKEIMSKDDYYTVHYHEPLVCDSVPKHFKLWQTGICSRQLIMELGGFNCLYETLSISLHVDLAVRMQFYGANFIMQNGFINKTEWSPERTNEPVTIACWEYDIPMFHVMNQFDDYKDKIKINLDNWKESPSVWERRIF